MSFAIFVTMMLLCSSVVTAFVLQTSREERAASADPPAAQHNRFQSLHSIRKSLLEALDLQTEPQLPAAELHSIREQWMSSFRNIDLRAKHNAGIWIYFLLLIVFHVAALSGFSMSPDAANTSLTCCSTASEISMKDLGWDSWVIYPTGLTIVQCAHCTREGNTVQNPPTHTNGAHAQVQVPCCRPTSRDTVPIVYMDESSSIVISSVQLIRNCGCGPGDLQQLGQD
ncbi:uncharacterized protein LOC117530061 [Thalassophryne amazonica]|uniref:uncharacterized protein LOC117530061 n=1 Tax=Thalassophryne amazonica TaxID=390379 RepID=UPI001472174C|nr:uncharacterized protein LOC117530061 [Thalassophryne amazonica]